MRQNTFKCNKCGSANIWAGSLGFEAEPTKRKGMIICLDCGLRETFEPPLDYGIIEVTEKGRRQE